MSRQNDQISEGPAPRPRTRRLSNDGDERPVEAREQATAERKEGFFKRVWKNHPIMTTLVTLGGGFLLMGHLWRLLGRRMPVPNFMPTVASGARSLAGGGSGGGSLERAGAHVPGDVLPPPVSDSELIPPVVNPPVRPPIPLDGDGSNT